MTSASNRLVSSVLSVIATVGLVAIASPARAATLDVDAPRQAVVHASDLDLASKSDRATFRRRLNYAVHKVCGTQLPGLASVDRVCSQRVVTDARRKAGLDEAVANG